MHGIAAHRLLIILVAGRVGGVLGVVPLRSAAVHALWLPVARGMGAGIGGGRDPFGDIGAADQSGPRGCGGGAGREGGRVGVGEAIWTHVGPIRREGTAGGGNHLGAQGAGRGAGQTSIPRVLDPMDNGGLAVVTVNSSFGIDGSLKNCTNGSARSRGSTVESRGRKGRDRRRDGRDREACGRGRTPALVQLLVVVLLGEDLLDGRLPRVGDEARVVLWEVESKWPQGLVPGVFILLVKAGDGSGRKLQWVGRVVWQRLRRSCVWASVCRKSALSMDRQVDVRMTARPPKLAPTAPCLPNHHHIPRPQH